MGRCEPSLQSLARRAAVLETFSLSASGFHLDDKDVRTTWESEPVSLSGHFRKHGLYSKTHTQSIVQNFCTGLNSKLASNL